jgi:prepilin signal peptidase PulO-like enzyme (type II secretory pathway)
MPIFEVFAVKRLIAIIVGLVFLSYVISILIAGVIIPLIGMILPVFNTISGIPAYIISMIISLLIVKYILDWKGQFFFEPKNLLYHPKIENVRDEIIPPRY